MYRIAYKKAAAKALGKMPKKQRNQLIESFRLLAEDPERRDLDTRGLKGRPGYRLRVGGWRAIYEVANTELTILVLHIGARGDVYK